MNILCNEYQNDESGHNESALSGEIGFCRVGSDIMSKNDLMPSNRQEVIGFSEYGAEQSRDGRLS